MREKIYRLTAAELRQIINAVDTDKNRKEYLRSITNIKRAAGLLETGWEVYKKFASDAKSAKLINNALKMLKDFEKLKKKEGSMK